MAVGATRGKKRLARYLKPLIEQADLQVDDLVQQVRCSRPTIFRLLSGDALPGWPVVLAVLGLMVEQLDRLLAAGREPAVTIRVIPFSAGPYPASAGSMTLFSYDGEDRPELGFTEQLSGLKPVDQAADVDRMIAMWEQAQSFALDESGSAALIAAVRGEHSGVAQEQ
jgi:hypothetical protein